MTPKGADLDATDLIEVSTIVGGSYVTKSITGQELIDAIPLPPSGLTVGTTPISSGTIGRVLFQGTGNVLQQSSSLAYDDTLKTFTLIGPIGSVFQHTALTNYNGFGGFQLNVADGTERAFVKLQPNSGEFKIGTTSTGGYFTTIHSGGSEAMRIFASTRNIGINTTTDAGFRLDVNGTARVQNDLSVSRNQNNPTKIAVSNTTAGNNSFVEGGYASDASSGECKIGKYSSTTSAYKIITASNAYLYNGTIAGDIAILNDFSTGRIKFATGGVSTPQMNLFSTGNFAINTTTDAGYKLDVNGTARVSGNFNIATGFELNFNNANVGIYRSANSLRLGGYGGIEFLSSPTTIASQTVRMVLFDTGNLCIGNTLDVASARLIVNSTTQGFLPPRMTTTQKNAIASPAAGLVVYDTTLAKLCVYTTTWETITSL
jgi:hypothetical protein